MVKEECLAIFKITIVVSYPKFKHYSLPYIKIYGDYIISIIFNLILEIINIYI
jgi:hypothetical protein